MRPWLCRPTWKGQRCPRFAVLPPASRPVPAPLLCWWLWQTPLQPLAWLIGCFASCSTCSADVFLSCKSFLQFRCSVWGPGCIAQQFPAWGCGTALGSAWLLQRPCRILSAVPCSSPCAGVTYGTRMLPPTFGSVVVSPGGAAGCAGEHPRVVVPKGGLRGGTNCVLGGFGSLRVGCQGRC